MASKTCTRVAPLIIVGLLFSVLSSAFPVLAAGASLYLSPSSGTYAVGDTITVGVYLSSSAEAANAVSGSLAFSSDTLQATALSTSGSVVSLWVREPSYSAGSASFEGIILNPGYSGSSGKIISLSFRATAAGTGTVHFGSGSVLANDGNGTEILAGTGSASFTIQAAGEKPAPEAKPKPEEEKEQPTTSTGEPAAPTVTSSTHPNSDSWYSNANPQFSWSLAADVTGVSVMIDQDAQTVPSRSSNGLFSGYGVSGLADGTWYAHVRLQNDTGWGETTHFRFRIDTNAPSDPEVSFLASTTIANEPLVSVAASDDASGVYAYLLQVDSGQEVQVLAESVTAEHPYVLRHVGVGDHTLTVVAVDKAGNLSGAVVTDFTVEPVVLQSLAQSYIQVGPWLVSLSGLGGALLVIIVGQAGWIYVGWKRRQKMSKKVGGKKKGLKYANPFRSDGN